MSSACPLDLDSVSAFGDLRRNAHVAVVSEIPTIGYLSAGRRASHTSRPAAAFMYTEALVSLVTPKTRTRIMQALPRSTRLSRISRVEVPEGVCPKFPGPSTDFLDVSGPSAWNSSPARVPASSSAAAGNIFRSSASFGCPPAVFLADLYADQSALLDTCAAPSASEPEQNIHSSGKPMAWPTGDRPGWLTNLSSGRTRPALRWHIFGTT